MIDDLGRILACGDPGVWQHLLADHVPDATGACRRCTAGSGFRPVWPCRLHLVAATARDVATADRTVARGGTTSGPRVSGGRRPAGSDG